MAPNKSNKKGVGRKKQKGHHEPKFDATRQERFLKILAASGIVTPAAKGAGVSRFTVYRYRDIDPDFARRWREAEEAYADALEKEAYRRAVIGTLEPVFYQGEVVGKIRRYSDSLLAQKLKARRPDKYRERVSMDANVNVKSGVLIVPQDDGNEGGQGS